jgi:hypothetical protein
MGRLINSTGLAGTGSEAFVPVCAVGVGCWAVIGSVGDGCGDGAGSRDSSSRSVRHMASSSLMPDVGEGRGSQGK